MTNKASHLIATVLCFLSSRHDAHGTACLAGWKNVHVHDSSVT